MVMITDTVSSNAQTHRATPPDQQINRFSLLRLLGLASLFANARGQLFPARFELSELNETTGVMIHGAEAGDISGQAVAVVRDLNGDDIADCVIGGPGASQAGRAGKVHVVFGSRDLGLDGPIELSGSNGTFGGVEFLGMRSGDFSGTVVAGAGDMNGDGFSDLIVGARREDPEGRSMAGSAYVLYGGPGLTSGRLDLVRGFRVTGAQVGGECGASVAGGADVNGDGVSDLLIGAPNFKPFAMRNLGGATYAVFGGPNRRSGSVVPAKNLRGSMGATIFGRARDQIGWSLAFAGDLNDDGISDIAMSAPPSSPAGRVNAGRVYVIFGRKNLGEANPFDINYLRNGTGVTFNGERDGDYVGTSVAGAGDVNADGIADLVIGSSVAAGRVYVIFGGVHFGRKGFVELSSLNGTTGFVINGNLPTDRLGTAVSSAGDFNSDGIDDLLVGAAGGTGKAYVIFGKPGLGANGLIELAALNETTGVAFLGEKNGDACGSAVAGGADVNGDGVPDIIIGARGADPSSELLDAGKAYVVFGRGRATTPMSAPQTTRATISAGTTGQKTAKSPLESPSLALPLGIAGGVCAVVSSVAMALIALKCRRKQEPLQGAQLNGELTVRNEYSLALAEGPASPDRNRYEQLQLQPVETHYTSVNEVVRRHDEYESAKAAHASGYAIWPQNPPKGGE